MKRRHVLAVLGLSYLTLGIYTLYWLYKTRQELLPYLPDKKAIPKLIVLFIPWFVAIGLAIVTAVVTGVIVASSNSPYNSANLMTLTTIVIIMLGFLAVCIVSFWWFYRYFTAVELVVQGNDAMLLYTLWIVLSFFGLGPVWVLMVQGDLNKFMDNGYRPLKTPTPPAYSAAEQQTWHQPPQPPTHQPHHPYPPQPPEVAHHQTHPHHQPEHHGQQPHEDHNEHHPQPPQPPYQG